MARTTRILKMAAVALVTTFSTVPATFAESLSDSLVSAYRSSGLLDQQRALLRVRDEDLAQAVAATRPTLNYSAAMSGSYTSTRLASVDSVTASLTLAASLTLYDFGRSQLSIDLARENVLMARETLRNVEQQVLLRAVSAFLNVRSAHETAMLQANNVRLMTEQRRASRDRFEVGEITQTDVSLTEASLAAARSGEAAARGKLMVAREEFKAAVGHYPNGLRVPPTVSAPVSSLEQAKAIARKNHPDVLAAQRAVTVAELAVELARRSTLPSVEARATSTFSAGTGATDDFKRAAASITVAGPIYQGGRLTSLYRQAKAQAEAARAALHLTVQTVEKSVASSWAQLAVAGASLTASDQQIRARRVALRGAREEQTLGARTTLEVLTFEQDLLDAQAAAITAQADQYLAVYSLMSAMGILTAEKLHLGIATYDPEVYYHAVENAPLRVISPQGEQLETMLEALGRK